MNSAPSYVPSPEPETSHTARGVISPALVAGDRVRGRTRCPAGTRFHHPGRLRKPSNA